MRTGGPAICLSIITVSQSYLIEKATVGLPSKRIEGTLLSLEWERLAAVVCSVFGHEEMQVQMSMASLTFATKPGSGGGEFCFHIYIYIYLIFI